MEFGLLLTALYVTIPVCTICITLIIIKYILYACLITYLKNHYIVLKKYSNTEIIKCLFQNDHAGLIEIPILNEIQEKTGYKIVKVIRLIAKYATYIAIFFLILLIIIICLNYYWYFYLKINDF